MVSAAAFFLLWGERMDFRRSLAKLAVGNAEDATDFFAAAGYTGGVDRR